MLQNINKRRYPDVFFMITTVLKRSVLLRAAGFTFRFTQKTCHFSTSHSPCYPALEEEMVKPNSQANKKVSKGKGVASSNWLDLKKALDSEKPVPHRKKRQKLDSGKPKDILPSTSSSPEPVPSKALLSKPPVPEQVGPSKNQGSGDVANENSRTSLRFMAMANEEEFSDEQRLPGRYLALDCEMVGVGINASESSLARVSLVNYYGAVVMDEYVKQRERVVDYRTRWSGIRASDITNAKPFDEVQKAVNDLLDGRILIGHAVYNDLKALLLSHPTRQTRDTQSYAYKFALSKSRHISLKNLAKQELGIDIQTGEHSSVVDARVTMAIYRLYKKDWERASGTISQISKPETAQHKGSTQAAETNGLLDPDDEPTTAEVIPEKEAVGEESPTSNMHRRKRAKLNDSPTSFPGGGRKGVSSGLSTVVRRGKRGAAAVGERAPKSEHQWWKLLPSSSGKGSVRLDR